MSDADIVRSGIKAGEDGAFYDFGEALAALDRMVEDYATLEDSHRLTVAALEKEEDQVDRLKDLYERQAQEAAGFQDQVARLKDQLAEAEKSIANEANIRVEWQSKYFRLEENLAEADANGLRLAEENERLTIIVERGQTRETRIFELEAVVEQLRQQAVNSFLEKGEGSISE